MQLSNVIFPLALIASTLLAAPTPTAEHAALEKRTHLFAFDGIGNLYAGQPPNFSAANYPYFCYFSSRDIKIYYHNPPNCGSTPVQNTDPNATIA